MMFGKIIQFWEAGQVEKLSTYTVILIDDI